MNYLTHLGKANIPKVPVGTASQVHEETTKVYNSSSKVGDVEYNGAQSGVGGIYWDVTRQSDLDYMRNPTPPKRQPSPQRHHNRAQSAASLGTAIHTTRIDYYD